ncbi:hypothetical protein MGYG_08293 [Nannizzia gypsea CBS 118893]|uniref:Zn(2)-C6 fungal-type domain-containing protein n=1 Tax=Arthroderma gypseum (strain ATCC MYA-4604 / CBS 118893) TaxID=535722 RepID=E4V699_ARTGP|nr:hypothetical protein MGYG_08293 [Nannizzia gypsea CBS 118893]EFR05282.1 hypothetical protein MGYG_08293 [Nannizzia gypsea CBS 118893]
MDPNPIDDHSKKSNAALQPLQPLGHGNVKLTPNYWYRGPELQSHQRQYQHPLTYWHHPHSLPNQPVSPQEAFHGQSVPASPAIPEQKKHKRTRSGCFTCRARRVKCDEKRPTCDRCGKGKRECVYPPPVQKSAKKHSVKVEETCPVIAESEPEGEENEKDQNASRITSKNPQEAKSPDHTAERRTSNTVRKKLGTRRSANTSHQQKSVNSDTWATSQDASVSPASDVTAHSTGSHSPTAHADTFWDPHDDIPDSASSIADTPSLSDDVKFFLGYHTQHITHTHYMMKSVAAKFISEDLMKYALEYEPLLYAVVAFSAYHYSIRHPNGRLYTFLQYYNKSVSSLLFSLKSHQPHKDATILTILQLTTFEEYVGDWVNLIDHHHAAHQMILQLYSPDKVLDDRFRMHIVHWNMRYDVMAGLMAGNATILGREWYIRAEKKAYQEATDDPNSLSKELFAFCACNKRCAVDLASLLGKVSQNLISQEEFLAEGRVITETMTEMIRKLGEYNDPNYLVMSYPEKIPLGINDIVDPYVPGLVHTSPFSEVDLVKLELRSSLLMYNCQIGLITQSLEPAEMSKFALEQCQLVETINRLPEKASMFPLMFHNVLGLICLYIPPDDRHRMWCRKRLAEMEQHGYIYPPAFRARVADIWKVPEVADWWLPNSEGYPKLVREIREWTSERTTNPRDNFREAVRDIRSIFGRMTCSDDSSQGSSPSAHSGIHQRLSPPQSPP